MKKHVAAGRFKAECLALLGEVAETREPLIVTKRGRPVAEVIPVQHRRARSLRGSVTFRDELLSPVLGDWEIDR